MRALVAILLLDCSLGLSVACAPEMHPVATRSARHQTISEGTAAASAGATVALVDPLLGTSFCSGTLVAPRVVVTAAHCLTDVNLDGVLVAVGVVEVDEADPSQLFEIASATPHPQFRDAQTDDPDGMGEGNDVGLVALAEDAAAVTPVPFLRFSGFDAALQPGSPVVIQGFGMSGSFDLFSGGTLRVASTPYQRRIATEFLAGGSNHPDSCNGDSGGPAYYVDAGGQHWLAGVTSRGTEAAGAFECGAGGIYSIASQYASWFEDVSGGLLDDDAGAPPSADPPPPPAGDDPRDGADDLDGRDDGAVGVGPDQDGPTHADDDVPPGLGDDGGGGCDQAGGSSAPLSGLALALLAFAAVRKGAGGGSRSSARRPGHQRAPPSVCKGPPTKG